MDLENLPYEISGATFGASEVTLLNPDPPTELVFTKNSTLNTTLLLNGRPRYKIETVDAALSKTDIKDLRGRNAENGKVVVKLRKKLLLGDTITFINDEAIIPSAGRKAMKQREWLVEGRLEDGGPKWTVQTGFGEFLWRLDPVHRLMLCPASNLYQPIVYAQTPSATEPWALILSPGAEKFCDEIVTSYLIVEGSLREKEKRAVVYVKAPLRLM
ncbi:hypothetical protein CPC08DRAFT_710304 [Agrocybe pediades]|nr:hypothetical protein CPC08DRAFT_710304 [Agrocybe pediades]